MALVGQWLGLTLSKVSSGCCVTCVRRRCGHWLVDLDCGRDWHWFVALYMHDMSLWDCSEIGIAPLTRAPL